MFSAFDRAALVATNSKLPLSDCQRLFALLLFDKIIDYYASDFHRLARYFRRCKL